MEKEKYRPAYKVHLAPAEDIQDETLISIGKLHILKEKYHINSFVRDLFFLFFFCTTTSEALKWGETLNQSLKSVLNMC